MRILLEFVSLYGMIFILGIIILVVGIILAIRNKKFKANKIVQAIVIDCVKREEIKWGSSMERFEVTFEIQTEYCKVRKQIKRQEPYDVGASFDVYYDFEKDKFAMSNEVDNNAGTKLLIGIGVFVIVATIFAGMFFKDIEKCPYFFGSLIGMAFAFIGFWLCVLRPSKLKRQMKDCEIVLGTGVDYLNVGRTRDTDGEGFRNNYFPIYEYYYGGVPHRIKSSSSGSGTGLGRTVKIVVNHRTGEAYCLDDEKEGIVIGIVFLIFGLVATGIMIWLLIK